MSIVFQFPPNPPGTYTNGAVVPASAVDYDTMVGSPTYDTSVKFKDLPVSIKFAASLSSVTAEQTFSSPVINRYMTRVMRCSAFTAGTFVTISRVRLGGTSLAEVRMNSAGELLLRIGSTTVVTHSIGFGVDFRFEWDVIGDSAATSFRVYTNPLLTTPTTSYGPFEFATGQFDRIIDGAGGTTTATETTNLLYAADGDTSNPGLSRWATTATGAGLHKYALRGGLLVPITARAVRGGTLV